MRSRVAIVGVLFAVVLVMVWNLLLFAPKGRDLSAAKKEAQAAQAIEPQLRAALARLQEISKNGPDIAAQLDQLSAAVPTAPDLDGFILSANQIAVQSGIDWLSVSPTVAQPGTSGPSVIPLTISIQGGFFQVLDYLNRLEDLPRLVIIDGLNVNAAGADNAATGGAAPSTGAPPLAVTLTGRMFTMAAPVAPAGSTPAPSSGASGSTPPASGNSSGNTTSTSAQVN